MPSKTYEHLHARLTDLIAEGEKIADEASGTPADGIHEWVNRAGYCLGLLEDKIPTAVAEFRNLRANFEFTVADEDQDTMSPSGYRDDEADVLRDFNFEVLKQANNILRFAATKLEMEGHSLPAAPSDEQLGEALRAARIRAGHSQRDAGKKIGYDHKYISEWETGKGKPHVKAAKNIRDYILLYPENK